MRYSTLRTRAVRARCEGATVSDRAANAGGQAREKVARPELGTAAGKQLTKSQVSAEHSLLLSGSLYLLTRVDN